MLRLIWRALCRALDRTPGRFALEPGVPTGWLPRRKTAGSAAYDLAAYLPEPHASLVVQPGQRVRLRTGVRLALRAGWHAVIYDRSSMRWRGLSTLGVGVIDADYQDELCVILANLGTEPQTIGHGDAIAQLAFARTHTLGDKVAALRTGGFGSTGSQHTTPPSPPPPATWPSPPALRLKSPAPGAGVRAANARFLARVGRLTGQPSIAGEIGDDA